ncbi:Nif11-like leader peptide family natural product precursor [Phormidium sp. CLA17]|uniref:Nif11-like leader peptide family natural product precursor n=1 Tax=Leptolyngbya sp. Cla-17 TaxID=2803751 RepID=UPI001492BD72|nr:Nif11-like leader peptide family natural product precursor [Leptolyngbya sp. Cla-17]MBM0744528.1 Nif11-like leader peptide family natural product precursor [Leptolyngbya sp. Cla-17]
MAKEAVAQLFRAAKADPTLRDRLNQATTIEQFAEMAKSYGYEFTIAEWQSMTGFAVEEFVGELSEIPGL